MTSLKTTPLDEISWTSPHWLQANQGVHDNSVLHFFAESPFFDRTSNNAVLQSQAWANPQAMMRYIATRAEMEERLKSMSGIEFLVIQAPAEMAPGTGTGVWVIGKQHRQKRHGEPDQVTRLATYFIVNEVVFMAPSVADVLSSRMLTTLSSMSKFMEKSESFHNFSPALGYSNLPPKATRPKGPGSQFGQLSKENTPMPDSVTTSQKALSTSSNPYLSHRLLQESLDISSKYEEEYMDDLPLTGQPGDFHLATKGRANVNKLMVPPASARGPSAVSNKPTPSPSPLKTDLPPARKDSKSKSPKTPATAGGLQKAKRRKSKAPGAGSISPTSSS